MKRFGSVAWNCGLREGKGSISTGSRALETYPYAITRYAGRQSGEAAWGGSCRLFHHVVRQTVRHGELRARAEDGGSVCALSASTQLVHPKPWRLEMPFVTFTVRRGLNATDKSLLSEAMLEAQVAAGYHRADRFHRFLEVDQDDLLVDPRFPNYATDRTDRFMVVEVVISSGRPTGTAATIADEAVRLFGERLHLAPPDILFVFHEVEPNLPRFPAASIRREATADA